MSPNGSQESERFAPPVAEVADVPDGPHVLAGRGIRLLAVTVDGVVQLALLWGVGMLTPWNIFSPDMASAGASQMFIVQLLSLVVFMLANGWWLVQRGQTIGKRITGIRIVRSDGSRAGVGRIIGLRYALGWALFLIPIAGYVYSLVDALLIFRANRRCLHDLIADTIVIKA